MTRLVHIQLTPTRRRVQSLTRALMLLLACSLGTAACAQQTRPDEPLLAEEAPERLARLSYTQGNVSIQGVGETEWAPAPVNRPLVPGDYLRTAVDGRAEVQIDSAAVRLGAGTSFSFVEMDEDTLRMRMSSGVAYVRVRDLAENEVIEVETPQATAAILRPGNYRLEVDEGGTTTLVKVSSGMLEARGGGESIVVRAQQTATLTGTGRFAYTMGTLGAPDSFDEWSLQRDRTIEEAWASESSKYVPRDLVGYEDLNDYGEWRSEPEYGYVWTPRVVAGWSPYRFGRYTYVSGWGWTWIADEPWGFAPFHYGSWVTIGGRWGWVPGPRHGRHYGRPGYVDRNHDWHVPRNPGRGISTREHPRNGLTNSGYRTIPNGSYRQPDGSYRGIRPGGNRMQVGPSGGNGSAVPPPANAVPPPANAVPSVGTRPDDRRMRIPRNELPRNTFPRNNSRVDGGSGDRGQGSVRMTPRPRMEVPRQEQQARPAPQPQQAPRSEPARPVMRDQGERRGRGLQPR